MPEHVDIVDAERHEPKGASTAVSGQVMKSNGDGTTSWVLPSSLINPTDFTVSDVLSGQSTAGSQLPSTTDTILQVEFGPALNGPSDPATLSSAGAITINDAGLYHIKAKFQFGRSGGAGTALLHLRRLLNGVQDGNTHSFKITDADHIAEFVDEIWVDSSASDVITYEIIRDSTGNDSGGLLLTNPTLAGWDDSPTAYILVQQFVQS